MSRHAVGVSVCWRRRDGELRAAERLREHPWSVAADVRASEHWWLDPGSRPHSGFRSDPGSRIPDPGSQIPDPDDIVSNLALVHSPYLGHDILCDARVLAGSGTLARTLRTGYRDNRRPPTRAARTRKGHSH